ncbi:MAG TPA: enoyl-CoA hydratase/isomerase family protein [Actinomycetota bacterium]
MALITVGRMDGLEPVALLTLNRPEQRNAVSSAMLEQLTAILGDLAVDPEVRAVVLAGAGPDFCAGADVAELAEALSGHAVVEYRRAFDRAFSAISDHPVPVIARIHGAAFGGGCQLAVACDLAVAAEDARLGIPSARLGIVISFESLERLVLAVGPKRAGEILFSGRVLSGGEAAAWGLVNRTVPASDLDAALREMASAVAEAAPLSVRGSKRGITTVLENLRLERFTQGQQVADFEMMAAEALSSEDLREGIRAFRERRKPRFKGT